MVESFENKKVTIMGLGLHGGGLASALFFIKEGAIVTITDLRSAEVLKPTTKKLESFDLKYRLGTHVDEDFIDADLVIKNPGVPSNSKYLKMAKRIETDISIFLGRVNCPIIAITGSKGKSSTVSAIDYILKQVNPKTQLGGNITVSPLTFLDQVDDTTPVILELSSWQLGDIKGRKILKSSIATVTNIMNDHQNAYNNLEEYADDKAVIFEGLKGDAILNYQDDFTPFFCNKLNKTPLYFSNKLLPKQIDGAFLDDMGQGWMQIDGRQELILGRELTLKGGHQRENMLLAALILKRFNIETSVIKNGLAKFKGIAHRMEFCREVSGIKFYNDSAATIPEAVCAAILSFKTPVRLISGGTDKELDFSNIATAFSKVESIHLLEGTGTDKMIIKLNEGHIKFNGPYSSLDLLMADLKPTLKDGDSVLFSPGATSFGMFNNEFHRGDYFKDIVSSI